MKNFVLRCSLLNFLMQVNSFRSGLGVWCLTECFLRGVFHILSQTSQQTLRTHITIHHPPLHKHFNWKCSSLDLQNLFIKFHENILLYFSKICLLLITELSQRVREKYSVCSVNSCAAPNRVKVRNVHMALLASKSQFKYGQHYA